MSFVKVLGLFDIVCAILFALLSAFSVTGKIFYPIAIYLLAKGGFFTLLSRDFASIIDVICGLYAILLVFGISHYIPTTLTVLYLGQKAVFSFMG